MYISKISFEKNDGARETFSLEEKRGLIVTDDAEAALGAVSSALGIKGYGSETEYNADVIISGDTYSGSGDTEDEYGGLIARCAADDACCVFDFSKIREFRDPLEVYRNYEQYMTSLKFRRITSGAGTTHTFRRVMRGIEREFPITKETAKGAVLRSYLFFLRAALFWDTFNLIRNPRHEGKPLIVLNAPKEIRKMRDPPINPDRQVLLIN